MRRLLMVTLASLALTLLGGSVAGAAVPDFGPPLWKCGGAVYYTGSGCYGYDSGPGAMSDASTFNLFVSPHIVHPGQTLTATMVALDGAGFVWPASVAGLTQSGLCAAGQKTCTYIVPPATTSSTQWQEFSMSCCGGIESDYYAVLADASSISGTVKNRSPAGLQAAVNAQVTIAGTQGTFTTTTNPAGEFQRNVPDGTYTVRTADRHCVKAQLPQCVTSKEVTVGPDATIDFEQPSEVRIEGIVKDAEDSPLGGVTIRADDPGGGRLDTAVSGANGRYEMVVRAGAVRLSADDPEACVISSGSECPKTKDFDVSRDTTVDWRVKGCVKKVDFGGSMIAVNGCFTKVDDDKWETEKYFLMNGLAVFPGSKVTLDKVAQTIVFGDVTFKVFGVIPILHLPTLTLNFAAAKQTVPNDEFTVKGVKIPKGTLTLTSEAGKSTLAIAAKIPLAFGNPERSTGDNACPGEAKITLSAQFTNDDGARQLGFAADDAGADFCIAGKAATRPDAAAGGAAAPKSGLRLEGVRGTYDLVTHWWTLGAKLSGLPSIGGTATVDGEVTLDDDFWPRRFVAKVDSINQVIEPPELFWQRIDMNVGNDAPNTPFKLGFGAGFSLFKKGDAVKKSLPLIGEIVVIPSELVALDGSFTVAVAPGASSVADIGLEGSGTFKVWDSTFITGKLSYIGTSSSFLFDGRVGFTTPNGQFGLEGRATGFWDVSRSLVFAEGTANLRVPGISPLAADVVLNAKKGVIAACVSDPFTDEPALNRFGVVYELGKGVAPVRGCDVSQYRETPPKALGAANARSFTVKPGTGLMIAEVTGAGSKAPQLTVTGPGKRLKMRAGRGAGKGALLTIPAPGTGKTFVVLRHARAGRWSISPQPGSVIRKLRFAGSLPTPVVRGSTSGNVCKPVLRWSARALAGQTLTIVDSGPAGDKRVLVAKAKASGSVVVPKLATGGERTAQALVFNGDTLRATLPLTSYAAPGGAPGAPDGLTVRAGKGGKLLVRWRAACGSKRYAVAVGAGKPKTVRGTSISLARPKRATTVSVTSLDASGVAGGSASAPLAVTAG